MRKLAIVMTILLILSLVIGTIGCAEEEVTPTPWPRPKPTPSPTVAPTPTPTVAPTPTPTPYSGVYALLVESNYGSFPISYTGDYVGTEDTSFSLGPTTHPFTVMLEAIVLDTGGNDTGDVFTGWSLDGSYQTSSKFLTVNADDEHPARIATAEYVASTPTPSATPTTTPSPTLTPSPPVTYLLHVQSSNVAGVPISYSGNHTGTQDTPFDIGPETSPFTVTLEPPLIPYPRCVFIQHWELDGERPPPTGLTVTLDDAHNERTATAVYQPYTQLPFRLHGTVQVDGADVPDGTVITATIAGDTYTTTTPAEYGNSTYALYMHSYSNCYAEGTEITLAIGGLAAEQMPVWVPGGDIELNLSAAGPV